MWLAQVGSERLDEIADPETFEESRQIAVEGGSVANDARKNIEARTGKSVISPLNAKDKKALEVKGEKERKSIAPGKDE